MGTDIKTKEQAANKARRTRRRGMFRKSDSGTAAVEFAFCAPVFFMIVFGILEVGINYTADRMLNAALDTAARKIRTGEVARTPGYGETQFKDEICTGKYGFMFNCDKLLVDVQTVAAFNENSYETNDEGEVVSDDFSFAPGGARTINVARAFYEWPTVLNWFKIGQAFNYNIDVFGSDSRVIAASTAFVNEPFSPGS